MCVNVSVDWWNVKFLTTITALPHTSDVFCRLPNVCVDLYSGDAVINNHIHFHRDVKGFSMVSKLTTTNPPKNNAYRKRSQNMGSERQKVFPIRCKLWYRWYGIRLEMWHTFHSFVSRVNFPLLFIFAHLFLVGSHFCVSIMMIMMMMTATATATATITAHM